MNIPVWWIYGISYTYVYDVSARSIFIDHVNYDFVFIIFEHISPEASLFYFTIIQITSSNILIRRIFLFINFIFICETILKIYF